MLDDSGRQVFCHGYSPNKYMIIFTSIEITHCTNSLAKVGGGIIMRSKLWAVRGVERSF